MVVIAYVVPTVAMVKEQELVRQLQLETNLADLRSRVAYDDFLRAEEAKNAGKPVPAGLDTSKTTAEAVALRREVIRLRARVDESLQGARLLKNIAEVGIGMYVFGVILAAWGFRNWYVRLQKPLDEIVRRHALEPPDAGANLESGG